MISAIVKAPLRMQEEQFMNSHCNLGDDFVGIISKFEDFFIGKFPSLNGIKDTYSIYGLAPLKYQTSVLDLECLGS